MGGFIPNSLANAACPPAVLHAVLIGDSFIPKTIRHYLIKSKALPDWCLKLDYQGMLSGKKLGEAIDSAIKLKQVSQVDVAKHFGVRAPSVNGWITTGRIAKDKLPDLWLYFSDVVGPEHWGIKSFPFQPEYQKHGQEIVNYDVPLPTGIRGERRVPLLSWSSLRDIKKVMKSRTDSDPTVVAPGGNIADDAFAVVSNTDAFLSDIPRNATLVINPGAQWKTGSLALVLSEGSVVLRRLAMDGDRSVLIAHDAAPWGAVPYDALTDRIIGLVASAYKNFE